MSSSILVIGVDPDAVDYADPNLPPGLTAEKVKAALAREAQTFVGRGDRIEQCMLPLDGSAQATLAAQLARGSYDCIVIGAGLRKPEPNLGLFEVVINLVHRHAPGAAIAFNTRPDDSVTAADRALAAHHA
jgi:hypothetical protein